MSLSDTVGKFIEKQKLFRIEDKLLLAVSGGIDSMVMLDLLRVRGFSIDVAHVNYKLRNEDADLDELLVTQYCQKHEIPFYTYVVSKEDQVQLQKCNLQEVARHIRYNHFRQVTDNQQLKYICTAHHLEDKVETFFLNLMRGSGLKGLRSIQIINDMVRRPLLATSRQDIITYAVEYNVPHRQDQSNLSDKYNRNFLRHQILPTLKERWPTAIVQINKSTKYLADSEALLTHLLVESASQWKTEHEDHIAIGPLSQLKSIPGASSLIYYLMLPYQPAPESLETILNEGMITGSTIQSSDYEIIMDRDYLLIKKKEGITPTSLIINKLGTYAVHDRLNIQLTSVDTLSDSNHQFSECLDFAVANFPLTLRTWRVGDRMRPIGMQGRSKLISDMLNNAKIDKLSKASQLVLLDSNQEILWLVGLRLSEKCKITKNTSQIIKIQLSSSS